MTLLLATLLGIGFPSSMTAKQGISRDGGTAWTVECTNCSAGSVTVNGGGGTIDGGSVGVSSMPTLFIADAGVLNVNFPATQAVSIAAMPSTPVTGSFWQAVQNVNIVDAGPPINVNFPASQAVTGTFWQSTQPISGTVTALQANLDVALSTRTKPADQQHTIIDSSASIAVTGPLTDTQLRATAVPVSLASAPSTPVTGTFWQTTQPVSASALPLPTGAATDATASQLLDGGVTLLSAIAAAQTNGTQRVTVIMNQYPLNPFLPRCNPVRRTGCQP